MSQGILTTGPVGRLVEQLSKLPGVGRKTATRLAFHILKGSDDYARQLARLLVEVKEKVQPCSTCFALTDVMPCAVCSDERRNRSLICVVAGTADVMAIETTGTYIGQYHVLGGVLSPLDGVGPENLRIPELVQRIRTTSINEVVMALSPSVDGEATTHYLAQKLTAAGAKVTRIASGIPMGGDIEWADTHTLARALRDRRSF